MFSQSEVGECWHTRQSFRRILVRSQLPAILTGFLWFTFGGQAHVGRKHKSTIKATATSFPYYSIKCNKAMNAPCRSKLTLTIRISELQWQNMTRKNDLLVFVVSHTTHVTWSRIERSESKGNLHIYLHIYMLHYLMSPWQLLAWDGVQ